MEKYLHQNKKRKIETIKADKQCLTTYSAYFVIERINTLKEKI